MTKYTPIIDDTVPGFTADKIIVPFTDNPAVGAQSIKGFVLQIKQYGQTNALGTLKVETNAAIGTGSIEFVNSGTNKISLNTKEYYKFQLAYATTDNDFTNTESLAYSNVAIGYCVAQQSSDVNISVQGLSSDIINFNRKQYIGTFSIQGNNVETIYSYRFIVKHNANAEVI